MKTVFDQLLFSFSFVRTDFYGFPVKFIFISFKAYGSICDQRNSYFIYLIIYKLPIDFSEISVYAILCTMKLKLFTFRLKRKLINIHRSYKQGTNKSKFEELKTLLLKGALYDLVLYTFGSYRSRYRSRHSGARLLY